MEHALRKARLDLDSLNSLLRKKNVFSISDVDYAILETDGSLSVMKKEAKQPAAKSGVNLKQARTDIFSIPAAVISDGEINDDHLQSLNLNRQWLSRQLKSAGIHSIEDVFYAEVQKDGTLYIDTNNDRLH